MILTTSPFPCSVRKPALHAPLFILILAIWIIFWCCSPTAFSRIAGWGLCKLSKDGLTGRTPPCFHTIALWTYFEVSFLLSGLYHTGITVTISVCCCHLQTYRGHSKICCPPWHHFCASGELLRYLLLHRTNCHDPHVAGRRMSGDTEEMYQLMLFQAKAN